MKNYIETLDTLIDKSTYIIRSLEKIKNHELDEDTRNHQIELAVMDGERLAAVLRGLMINYTFEAKSTQLKRISSISGFYVYKDGADIVIELPPLPLRERKTYYNRLFIVDPLLYGLEQFVRETGHKPLEYGIVKIIHVRPEDTPFRKLRDYDNMEVKKILDAVSLHLLVDDNMRRCQVCHMSAFGEEAWTQIRVSPTDGGDKTLLKRVGNDVEKT